MKITLLIAVILFSAILNSFTLKGIQFQDHQRNKPGLLYYSLMNSSSDNEIVNIFAEFTFHDNIKMCSLETLPLYIDSSVLISATHSFFKKITETEKEESQVLEEWMNNFDKVNNITLNLPADNFESDGKIEFEDWMCNIKSWVKTCLPL